MFTFSVPFHRNFIFQTKTSDAIKVRLHCLYALPRYTPAGGHSYQSFLLKLDVTHRGEAVKIAHMLSNHLGPLITSKTRLKLLLRFFLNQNLSGYLQGLSRARRKYQQCLRGAQPLRRSRSALGPRTGKTQTLQRQYRLPIHHRAIEHAPQGERY